MEAFDKVFVDPAFLTDDPHGSDIGCTACHGGDKTTMDRFAAHEGLLKDPSQKPEEYCTPCHEEIAGDYVKTAHFDVHGLESVLMRRAESLSGEKLEQFQQAYNNHCATCHVSCADCHVRRPAPGFYGLLDGHFFKKTPSFVLNCTLCHGSRIGDEFGGKIEGYHADTHWSDQKMKCFDCHSEGELHGDGTYYETRYDVANAPNCIDCHSDVGSSDDNEFHKKHVVGGADFVGKSLACQVCHSQANRNCSNCHVGIDSEGLKYYKTDEPFVAFKIAKNVWKDDRHPYDYVVVRHIPVAPDLFAFYGDGLLPDFESEPTWKFATPHNIQRTTPRTEEGCNSCHGVEEWFLSEDDEGVDESPANDELLASPPAPVGDK